MCDYIDLISQKRTIFSFSKRFPEIFWMVGNSAAGNNTKHALLLLGPLIAVFCRQLGAITLIS